MYYYIDFVISSIYFFFYGSLCSPSPLDPSPPGLSFIAQFTDLKQAIFLTIFFVVVQVLFI